MGLFDFLFEPAVEMPKRMSDEWIAKGVTLVSKCIEEERKNRGADIRWRRCSGPEKKGSSEPSNAVTPSESRSGQRIAECFRQSHADVLEQPRTPDMNAMSLSFAAQLLLFVRQKCNGVGTVAYKRAGVSRKTYSKIISDARRSVSKRTAMQFAIGLQLSRAEAEVLLKSAGYAFAETIPEDVAFRFCIDNAIWSLRDLNAILRTCEREEIPLPSNY